MSTRPRVAGADCLASEGRDVGMEHGAGPGSFQDPSVGRGAGLSGERRAGRCLRPEEGKGCDEDAVLAPVGMRAGRDDHGVEQVVAEHRAEPEQVLHVVVRW